MSAPEVTELVLMCLELSGLPPEIPSAARVEFDRYECAWPLHA